MKDDEQSFQRRADGRRGGTLLHTLVHCTVWLSLLLFPRTLPTNNPTTLPNLDFSRLVEVVYPVVKSGVIKLLTTSYYSDRLRDDREILEFTRYIKTQQSVYGADCKAVIRTMLNRLNEHNVTWTQYYNTPRINNSNSIKVMKQRPNWPPVNPQSTNDSLMIQYIKLTNAKLTEPFPSDILYFESFKHCPNRAPHLCSKLAFKLTHKFYRK